ncbi:MAG: hypothetical protein ACAF41_32280 [Leptolyngbya sp. BL-A-14]
MLIRIAPLSLVLIAVTGCSVPFTAPSAQKTTPIAAAQSSRLTTALPPRSQRYASASQNQIDDQGYRDGYEDGVGNFPSNPSIGIANLNLTDPTEQGIYTDAYNRGYAQGKGQQPSPSPSFSPSPSPIGTVSPARRRELRQRGYQDGTRDVQSNFGSNPSSGIAALGLTDPNEIRIYTNAYNAGYQRQPSPSPSPIVSPGRLAELRQQGYNDGDADARSNFPQDASRGINRLGLVTAREQQAYSNGYRNGYQAFVNSQQPIPNSLW